MYKHESSNDLTASGYYRLSQGIQIIPISESSWWDGVSKGYYPKKTKIGPKTTAWSKRKIHLLEDMLNELEDYFQYVQDNGASFESASNEFLNSLRRGVPTVE